MSENLPWWKNKALPQPRQPAATPPPGEAKPGDSFLIVTEGVATEPVYFELLRDSLQLSTVTVKIIPGETSAPKRVIESAAAEVKAQARRVRQKKLAITELTTYDHVWAVIDTDVAQSQGSWPEVEELGRALNVKLAPSTPCFEFWLLLHLNYTTRTDLLDGEAAKKALRKALGGDYSTNRKMPEQEMRKLLSNWPRAVENAQKVRHHHASAHNPAPANPSTEVDLLVAALRDSAPPYRCKTT